MSYTRFSLFALYGDIEDCRVSVSAIFGEALEIGNSWGDRKNFGLPHDFNVQL